MDIFNGNRKLEEAVMYSIDWGVFLRHNIDGPLAPFMFLFDGEDMQTRVLMTDGDPMEYAMKVLSKEDKPYQQFVVGMEGYLRDDDNNRIDSIIVQGFDKTQEKGVVLGQMFEPKEQQGTFKKIGKISFLGSPESPRRIEKIEQPNYTAEEVGFSAMAFKKDELSQYMAFFTHSNPSSIANTMKRFLRSKISHVESDNLEGKFDLQITPGIINNNDFVKFLTVNAINEERKESYVIEWCKRTGREIKVNISHGDTVFMSEFINKSIDDKAQKPYSNPPLKSSKVKSFKSKQEVKKPWWKFW